MNNIQQQREHIITNYVDNLQVDGVMKNNLKTWVDEMIAKSSSNRLNNELHDINEQHRNSNLTITRSLNTLIGQLNQLIEMISMNNRLLDNKLTIKKIMTLNEKPSGMKNLVINKPVNIQQDKPMNIQPQKPVNIQSYKPMNIQLNKPVIQHKEMDYDAYKVEGLRELCHNRGLSTSRCRVRQDYIDLLDSRH